MTPVGKNIRTQRLRRGLSQEELAEKIFTTRQTISNYETGRSRPDVETLARLAEALDTEVSVLIYGEERRPRGDGTLWKRHRAAGLALLLVIAAALFVVAALVMTNWDLRQESSLSDYRYEGADPVSYVSYFASKYWDEPLEYQVFQTEGLTLVLTSQGSPFYFYPTERGWEYAWDARPVDGIYYAAPPNGPYPWSCRLMDGAGNVYEPVYEARFESGYCPVFAFDVSEGQEYRALLYGVDGTGALRYDGAVSYFGVSDWTLTEKEKAEGNTEFYRQHSAAAVAAVPAGPAFLAAYRAWRAAVWQTEPGEESGRAVLGLDGSFVLAADCCFPPSLVLEKTGDAYLDEWWGNDYEEYLYDYRDGAARYVWKRTWNADIAELAGAETVTPDMLRRAAATVSYDLFAAGEGINYGWTRTWDVTVPAEVRALWSQTCRALNGTE